jgi:dienelactone hydrolase
LTAEQQDSGTGPYAPGSYKTDGSLSGHTIYYPTKSTGDTTMPVLVWGNGACNTDGRSNSALLKQIASFGFLAIAEGSPNGGGLSNASTMKTAIDWITKAAGTGAYMNVDASRIMAAGFSCGGLEAIDNIWDSRVDTIGVISSGLLQNQTVAKDWRKPVLFVLGGSGDIAYANVSFPLLHTRHYFRLRNRSTDGYTRVSATTTTCLATFLLGRVTFLSAMAVH